MKRKILLGCSGGPDSMYLLKKLSKNRFVDLIVLHVNYHYRDDSDNDQKIVETFCKINKIQVQVKNVSKDDYEKYNHLVGFESKAREIRYEFFNSVATKEKTNILFLAHHKDDFIETAIMQHDRNQNLLFYGIEKKTYHHGLNIVRPLLKKYKHKILKYLEKHSISYAIDSTNFDDKFERNKIRLNLMTLDNLEKDKIYKFYKSINASNQKEKKQTQKIYEKWVQTKYDVKFFLDSDKKKQERLLYNFLTRSNFHINITSQKILSIIDFIEAKNYSKEYILMEDLILKVKDGKLTTLSK